MLSREELKSCFDGVPGFPAHSVDDFVFLFSLNGDGQIDFHAFLAVCKELTILRPSRTAWVRLVLGTGND